MVEFSVKFIKKCDTWPPSKTRLFYQGMDQNTRNWCRIFSKAGNELETSKARGIRDNHYETRSLLVPSSFPAWLKIRPLMLLDLKLAWNGRIEPNLRENLKYKNWKNCNSNEFKRIRPNLTLSRFFPSRFHAEKTKQQNFSCTPCHMPGVKSKTIPGKTVYTYISLEYCQL